MSFSPWQVLSPVQWAKWTWSAVRGGGGGPEGEEDPSQESGSDSEGNFDTPEAATPVPSPVKEPVPDLKDDITHLVSELSVKDNNNTCDDGHDTKSEPGQRSHFEPQTVKCHLDFDSFSDGPEINGNDGPTEVNSVPDNSINNIIDRKAEESSVDALVLMDNEHKLKDGKPQSLTDSLLEDIKNSNCYTEDLNSNALQGSAIVSDEVFGTEGTQEDNKEPSHERTDDAREASESDTKKDLPRKNRKPGSRLPSRIQKESANRTSNSECHSSAPDLDNVPLPKSSYNFDPSHFDDPDFNPFGGKATLPPSPTLPKGSYKFDEETGDELTPSKSSSGLSESDSRIESGSANSSPKASRSRLITNSCKVQNYEGSSLVLDTCAQEDDAPASIEKRQGHATDEEKLASVPGHKSQPEEEQEFFECTSDSSLGKQPLVEQPAPAIITKETEVKDWQTKYDESHREVLEMRKIVAEYEKTIAQMIEDEHRSKMASQKSLQQLTKEKDQAISDLNSVERSLSDLFRRYENLKGVLEGFKKNEEVLKKCAQDYLSRVKQEEQRYQALKLHAEEKLNKANEEIAQVRTKAKAESAALNAGLRKEQMKVESLERALQQKNQEIEELTKICDELIAKMGRSE
ncbi:hypothetical protein XENTR_v10009808 [Xenopus tropicalis]|uniref:Transforming acidic coiled-coil-containing protein 1 isoform X5 n=1 Tax=Xenopus tropicalis TaxID=8364 RepID=A0A8J0S9Y7_XENTR|nr:transforming acidic coiled-coil-containing protein 1 isoform X5 [Xenopus tropicalis]KAE8619482.1 hypothetical protein XENTR_v10009808 [Xenopus tropicalis]KAE8619483.1 hypothetical protein XENTR_v10009808 [Xenopus tropicalis]KAE8619484.1 hypothetical protein XENTR_v10009808 [Xenopus tropicalis]KAE8619485.1 hypothetical protein XENTR_v10009808 [Xenopus tropicalis]KAE8619486.1 hypothetical protein XENTR_v10009808 [Xenopus tropicalis]|eukprot:XP_012814847.1 PREDICTED: transforming acidic coiled-coil-containing protein 1 isoform X5 [Xenopus tropicalis]